MYDDLKQFPKANIGQVLSFILKTKSFSTEYIGEYKIKKTYSYYKGVYLFIRYL